MDHELEPFIPLLPDTDMNDPATARKNFADRTTARPGADPADMTIRDRTVPADPDVPVRTYRPSTSRVVTASPPPNRPGGVAVRMQNVLR